MWSFNVLIIKCTSPPVFLQEGADKGDMVEGAKPTKAPV